MENEMGMTDTQWRSYVHNIVRNLRNILKEEDLEELKSELEAYAKELEEDSKE